MTDLRDLTDDELRDRILNRALDGRRLVETVDEFCRRLSSLTAQRDEARKQVRLHVECMCGHAEDDHDGECHAFRVGEGGYGGAVEVECGCENFRPAWAAWWQRSDAAEADRDRLTASYESLLENHNALADRFSEVVADRDRMTEAMEEIAANPQIPTSVADVARMSLAAARKEKG